VSDDGVDVAVEVSFFAVFEATEGSDEGGALVFGGDDSFQGDALVGGGVFLEEGDDLVGVDEPLVTVDGALLGEAVVSDGAAAFFDGAAGAAPAIGQGDEDVFAGGAEEVIENAVEGIEVLKDFETAGGVVALVFNGEFFDLLEIADEVGVPDDVDAEIFDLWEEFTERSLVATDVEDGGVELVGEVGEDEAGAVLAFVELSLVDGRSDHEILAIVRVERTDPPELFPKAV
jgi:hypothetical protein